MSSRDWVVINSAVCRLSFCGFISHLIGRETINIPGIFSGVHGFTRKTVSEETSEIPVHAFISSELGNCNSLLYGLLKHLLNRLRSTQNTAARIVTLFFFFFL